MNHPNSEQLLDLALGFDSSARSHLDQCPDCGEAFRALETEQDVLEEYYASKAIRPGPEALPRVEGSMERRRPWAAAVVAASLAIGLVAFGMLISRERPRPPRPENAPSTPEPRPLPRDDAEKADVKGRELWISSGTSDRRLSFFIVSSREKPAKEAEVLSLSEARKSGLLSFPDGIKSGFTRIENTSDKLLFLLQDETLKSEEKQEYRVGGDYRISAHAEERILVLAEKAVAIEDKSVADLEARLAKALENVPQPRGLAYSLGSRIVQCDVFGQTTSFRAALPALLRNALRTATTAPSTDQGPPPTTKDVADFLTSQKGMTTESFGKGQLFLFRKVAIPR